ncbi:hypothetical protein [Frankia gtarii]|uniref:hypothetical protein n=1 Tax=Frankia gtarii TaxID=2950102 RepID=UPI0021C00E17|nr:hypothetical protein [Frankia gtarii]
MSKSREIILQRIATTGSAIQESLLIDRALADNDWNKRARLLRNGLMVVAFNSLEDFVRQRSAELLELVSRTPLKFSALPKDLREAAVMEAFRSAHAYAQIAKREGDDPMAILQEVAAEVASTASAPLSISRFSLGYKGSNVTKTEIGDMLKAFNIKDAWREIADISSRAGLSILALDSAYDQAQRMRNAAAHRPGASIQPSDLSSFCQTALAVALGFDVLASRASRLIHEGDEDYASQAPCKISPSIHMIFVDDRGGEFFVKKEGGARALKRFDSSESAWNDALARARPSGDVVVERNQAGSPVRWAVTDTP